MILHVAVVLFIHQTQFLEYESLYRVAMEQIWVAKEQRLAKLGVHFFVTLFPFFAAWRCCNARPTTLSMSSHGAGFPVHISNWRAA
jgi:hypothetical protein